MDPNRKKEEGTTKENLDGGCAKGYDCKRVEGRSMDGQRGIAFDFRKSTEDVMIPEINNNNINNNNNYYYYYYY